MLEKTLFRMERFGKEHREDSFRVTAEEVVSNHIHAGLERFRSTPQLAIGPAFSANGTWVTTVPCG